MIPLLNYKSINTYILKIKVPVFIRKMVSYIYVPPQQTPDPALKNAPLCEKAEATSQKINTQLTSRIHPLSNDDLRRLKPQKWLNDVIINQYMNLLKPQFSRCHFFNTFFLTKLETAGYSGVKRWSSKTDILACDKILIPIHANAHWSLAVINLRDKRFEYYDSFGRDGSKWLTLLSEWLREEYKDKKGVEYDVSSWQSYSPKDIPQQKNSYDCGVFTCQFAKTICQDLPFTFTESDMPQFREEMLKELTC